MTTQEKIKIMLKKSEAILNAGQNCKHCFHYAENKKLCVLSMRKVDDELKFRKCWED